MHSFLTSRARQRNGVVQRCAKAPRDVQNAARAAEMSVTSLTPTNGSFTPSDAVTVTETPLSRVNIMVIFEIQSRRHQKSKTKVSLTPRKGMMSSKNLKRNDNFCFLKSILYFV